MSRGPPPRRCPPEARERAARNRVLVAKAGGRTYCPPMAGTLLVFAYGSLISDPELPELVSHRFWARLDGFSRRFNKRSPARGARIEHSWADDPAASRAFVHAGHADSLALGLEPDPDAHVVGCVFAYPKHVASSLIVQLDAREGFHRGEATRHSGYVPVVRTVHGLADGAAVEALLYLANADCPLVLPTSVPDSERARILVAATPRIPAPRPAGVDYLADVRRALAVEGIFDPALERQARAVAELGPRWAARVGLRASAD
ncbi:MAG: hypothetical protein EP329_22165 [Deltaproteobacteria bacterium]|nr:MAG: hypothetical protein EP329_22165 [Deltaproteobacteria bacterium]